MTPSLFSHPAAARAADHLLQAVAEAVISNNWGKVLFTYGWPSAGFLFRLPITMHSALRDVTPPGTKPLYQLQGDIVLYRILRLVEASSQRPT